MPDPARPSESAAPDRRAGILVVGTGAAGLFAAIWAGRTLRQTGRQVSLLAVDGARRLGAKILVAGGGRCNVTHERVAAEDYAGSTPPAIRKVLRRFDVDATVEFFAAAGVLLKREETGKLFPVTDSARTVLDALVAEARSAGTEILHPARITAVAREADGFVATSDAGPIRADRVILATGGKSLPKSGSDGGGWALAASLGHSLTAPIVPALVPLLLPAGHWITALSGLTLETEVTLRGPTGRRLHAARGSTGGPRHQPALARRPARRSRRRPRHQLAARPRRAGRRRPADRGPVPRPAGGAPRAAPRPTGPVVVHGGRRGHVGRPAPRRPPAAGGARRGHAPADQR
jgi:hypothetical protein